MPSESTADAGAAGAGAAGAGAADAGAADAGAADAGGDAVCVRPALARTVTSSQRFMRAPKRNELQE
jgi:hypothetical protein